MFAATCLALLVIMAIALIRAFIGPSVYDRIMAVNMFCLLYTSDAADE